MKKLSITIGLIVISFFTVKAAILEHKRIILQDNRIWDEDTKSLPFSPIDAYICDNSYIKIDFFHDVSQSVTFQIKDHCGNVIYKDVVITNTNLSYKINLDDLKPDQYELIYLDEKIEMKGNFRID